MLGVLDGVGGAPLSFSFIHGAPWIYGFSCPQFLELAVLAQKSWELKPGGLEAAPAGKSRWALLLGGRELPMAV